MSEWYMDENGEWQKRKTKAKMDEKGKVTSIAPPVNKKKEEEEQSQKRTWFKKSEGNLWQTILGSGGDVTENAGVGLIGLGEKIVDGLAMLAPALHASQMAQTGQVVPMTEIKKIANSKDGVVPTTTYDQMKKDAEEFVKMDLYDEEKVVDNTLGKLNKSLGIDTDANSVFGEKSDSLAQSGGQLLGQIALSPILPWYVTTGASSLGSEAESSMNQGVGFDKAMASGLITAGADILTEKLFGGSGLGEKGLINLEPLTKGITNKVVKTLFDFGIDVVAEGSEEFVAGVMSNLGTALYKEEDLMDILASEEAIDGYIESFIGGAVLGGGANAVNVGKSVKNKTDYRTGVTANEQKILDKAVEQRIAEAEKDGTKLTKKEKAEIEQDVLNSLQRGEIDIDTIEREFGGESYNALDSLKKESEEFKTLFNTKKGELSRADEVRLAELEAKNTENSYENRIFEAQNKLTEDVQKATENDGFIREVYGEEANKSKTFTLTEKEKKTFTAEEMKIVNKAIESGEINNTRKAHDMVSFVAKLSADLKTDFDFTNNKKLAEAGYTVEGKTIDGFKEGNKIAVNLQSKKALNTVVGHEITHVLEGTDLYTALQSTLKDYATSKGVYQSLFDTAKENYKNVYKGLSEAEYNAKIEQEVTADLVGEYIFSDTDFVRNLSTKNPNVFQKVFNEIKHMLKLATAGSDAEKQLLKAKKIFEDVYRDTKRNTSGETQLALNSNFPQEVDAWYNDKEQFEKKGGFFKVGSTSEALKSIDVKEQEIIWDKSKIREIMEKHPEMTIDVIKTVPNAIENPIIVMQSNTALNSITIYGEVYANVNGKQQPVMIAMLLKPEGKKGRILDIQKISSAYVRAGETSEATTKKAQSLIDNSEILYVDPNEKRTNDWLRALRLQLPAGLTKYGSIGKVTYSEKFVNNESEDFGKGAIGDALKRAGLKTSDETNKPQFSISDNASIEDKINSSMTMKEAKDMLQRVYNAVDIRGYRNADAWLQEMGSEDVAMTLESDYASYKKYIESNEDILNEEYTIADVLDAYMNGTLVGKQKESSVRLDTSKDTGFVDNRFYAPQDIKGGQDLYNIASQRVTNSNRAEVYKARADFIINAHNNGYIESLGLTREEVNKKLKSWANYTPKAMNLSNSLNEGVATQNRWTGIENSTILNTISVTEEELGNLVKSIDGNSSDWQRQYITSTMLALDTHIDYKGLSFVFDGSGMSSDTALGEYVDSEQTIYIRRAGQNTVAHEMGHYLDHLWGRDLGYSGKDGLTGRGIKLENLNAEQRQFVKNFYNFLNDIENSSDIGSAYKQSANEVFARFVARFTEWTKNQATNNRYGYEDKWYKDNFTERQYREFVKLLQEKAMLDTTKTQYSVTDNNKSIAPTPNGIYGKDVMLERSIAPLVQNQSVETNNMIAPSVSKMRQADMELQNELFPPMTEEDALARDENDWDRLMSMAESEAGKEIAPPIYSSDTSRLSEADLREVRKSTQDKLPLQRGRTQEFNDIIQRYSTSEYPNIDTLFEEIKDKFGKVTVTEEIADVVEVQNILKQTRINVSDSIKNGMADYVDTMRRNAFKLRFSKDGIPVDVAYQELSEMYPNMFPEDITNEVDQFEQMLSVANMTRTETGEFEVDDLTIGDMVNSIVATVRDVRTRHNKNTAERRARWFDKDQTLEEYMQTDDYSELEGNPNLLTVFHERWDRNRLTTEPQIDETTAQILDSEPIVQKKGFKENIKRKWAVFKANFIDKGAVFEDLAKVTKNRNLEAKWDYTMLAESQAQYHMQHGDENVKSLDAIREEVDNTGHTKEFTEYMYHNLNIDRMTLDERYGIENKAVFGNTITAGISQQKVAELESAHPEFKAYAQDVYDYMNNLRQRMVENGIVSQETANLWSEMYPHYVPIRRVDSKGTNINVPLATDRTGVNAPIKRATGGSSDILPLFDTLGQRTMQTFKAINKNDFGVELKNTLGSTISRQSQGVEGVIDMVETQDALLQEGKNGYNPTFTVFENGQRVEFEITQEMYEALLPMSDKMRDSGSKILQKASSFHRGVLTEYNPVFALTNAIKDIQDVFMNSQHPLKTYRKVAEATQQLLNKGQWYQEYMKNGGEDNSYFDTETNSIAPTKKGVLDTFPLKQISNLNNFIERVPRLAEYIASREMGRSVQESMLDASRVTTNFKAGGDVTKFLNRNGATFLNASVQGFAQQVRNVREANMNGLKGWGALATRFAVAGLPALLLNNLLWDDDDEYEELSDYVKQNYYVIGKYGDGQFIRIPKGRTVAVIQEAFNQMDKLVTGDDSADFKTFLEVLTNNLAPNNPISNNVIAPLIQAGTNKTWYGGDLVPQRLQDLPSAEQYDESTDSISKAIGKAFNISPMKVNYVLDQYTGLVGDMILPALTPEVTNGSEGALGYAIAPLKDKFTTDGVMNKQVITDFYDKSEELTTNAKKSDSTSEDVLKNKYLNSIKAEMNNLYKQKREVQNSDLPNKEKYAQVREIQKQISELAKEGMGNYENVEVYSNYGKVNDRHYHLNSDGEWQKITGKQLTKQKQVTHALGITANEYWGSKEEYDYMYEQPGKYGIAKVVGGYDTYKAISKSLGEIKAYKDQYGQTLNNTRKSQVVAYLNNLNADYYTKIMMYKAEYPSDDRYNREIIEYLNSRSDVSRQEMSDILTELGFKVMSDGRIRW